MGLGGVRPQVGVSACQRKLVGEASSFARFLRSKAGGLHGLRDVARNAPPTPAPFRPQKAFADNGTRTETAGQCVAESPWARKSRIASRTFAKEANDPVRSMSPVPRSGFLRSTRQLR